MDRSQMGKAWSGGMFAMGLTFTIIGISSSNTFLILGIVFLVSSTVGVVVSRKR